MDFHIKDVLKQYIKRGKISNGIYTQRISQFWNLEMGKSIVSRTDKIVYKDHNLFISINSAALKQELFNSREKVKELVNEYLGEEIVETVVIR